MYPVSQKVCTSLLLYESGPMKQNVSTIHHSVRRPSCSHTSIQGARTREAGPTVDSSDDGVTLQRET